MLHTVSIFSPLRGYFFCWTPSEGFVFHFIWRSFKVFDWMWSVWKHCIEYLCVFVWFWWHRGDVLLQFKLSSDSGRRDWRTYVKCFEWFVTSFFNSSTPAAFFTIKPETWRKNKIKTLTSKYKSIEKCIKSKLVIHLFYGGHISKRNLTKCGDYSFIARLNQTEYFIQVKLLSITVNGFHSIGSRGNLNPLCVDSGFEVFVPFLFN